VALANGIDWGTTTIQSHLRAYLREHVFLQSSKTMGSKRLTRLEGLDPGMVERLAKNKVITCQVCENGSKSLLCAPSPSKTVYSQERQFIHLSRPRKRISLSK
jgi:hypothetical protein